MSEQEIIENLHPTEAQVIGYTVASENINSERHEKEQALQALQQHKNASLEHDNNVQPDKRME